jgi:hypothetical protein
METTDAHKGHAMHIRRSTWRRRTPTRGPTPHPHRPRPYYMTMPVLSVHNIVGTGEVVWMGGAPCGRPSSVGTALDENSMVLAGVRPPLALHWMRTAWFLRASVLIRWIVIIPGYVPYGMGR